MYRDFTEEEKQKLLGYVQDDEDKNSGRFAGGVIDFFADIAHYSDLDINDYVNNIDDYHKKLIDAEDMTADNIEELFEAVHDVDDDTLTNIDIVKGLIESLQQSLEGLKTNIQIGDFEGTAKPLALPTEDYTEKVENEVSVTDAKTCAEVYNAYRDGDIEKVQEYLDSEVDELSRDVTAFGNQYTRTDLKVREEMVVDFYRLIDPDSADGFDELFDSCNDTISEFDRYNIMYIAYTADEPFRSIYLDSLGTYTLGDVNSSADSVYYSGSNTVNVCTTTGMFSDKRGAYTTFFHECGHAIDYNAYAEDGAYSNNYDFGGNYDVICGDIYDRIQSEIADYIDNDPTYSSLDEETRAMYIKDITECIYDSDGDTTTLSFNNERIICNAVVAKMNSDLSANGTSTPSGATAANYECPSDIYGGATDRVVEGTYHHSTYTDDNTIVGNTAGVWDDGEGYWYEEEDGIGVDRTSTGRIERETWAEYFSYSITGNETSLNCMQEYLPNTYDQYNQMAMDMNEGCF